MNDRPQRLNIERLKQEEKAKPYPKKKCKRRKDNENTDCEERPQNEHV